MAPASTLATWQKIALAAITLITLIIGGAKAVQSDVSDPPSMQEVARAAAEKAAEREVKNYDALNTVRMNSILNGIADIKVMIEKHTTKEDLNRDLLNALTGRVQALELRVPRR